MFSQFFEKKHLKINGNFKNFSQTGLIENHTPKTSLRNISKINCKSSQKLICSPFNSRSKSPVSPNIPKNLSSTPKNHTNVNKDKDSPKKIGINIFIEKIKKVLEKKIKAKQNLVHHKGDGFLNNQLERSLTKLKSSQKDSYSSIKNSKQNQLSNYLTNNPNIRVQTLPDSNALEFDSLTKFTSLQQKKNQNPEKRNTNSCKYSNDKILKFECGAATFSQFKENNKDPSKKPMINIYSKTKQSKEEIKDFHNERDLSNHSAKSSHSTKSTKKPFMKTANMNEKTANYTIHISKEKLKENENSKINEKFLLNAKMNDYEKTIDFLEKNKTSKFFNINCKGDNDWTPLHYAALNGNVKILNFLLSNDAIIDSETSSKLTPLMIASQK